MASYDLKTVSKTLHVLVHALLGFSHNNCVGMASIVQAPPGLLNACGTDCEERVSWELIVCKQKFVYRFFLST